MLDNEAQMKLQSELDALAEKKTQQEGCIFKLPDRTQFHYIMAVCEVNFIKLAVLKSKKID